MRRISLNNLIRSYSSINRYLFIFPVIFLVLLQTACDKKDDKGEPAVYSSWKPGAVYKDSNGWTECIVGNMPLVISVPHGGTISPGSIENRECQGAVTVRDMNTIELAMAIKKEMEAETGKSPFLIISNLSRKKLDQNRDIGEAICGNNQLKPVWELFHKWIDTALHVAVQEYGPTLYIDLHGQGHKKQRLEIGYRLSAKQLKNLYNNTTSGYLFYEASIYNLLKLNDALAFRDVIFGEQAFGSLMAKNGFPSVPAMQDPYPLSGDPYFNGGYNTERFTSKKYPKVFGWQIECNYEGVRKTEEDREAFAKAFVKVYATYIKTHVK